MKIAVTARGPGRQAALDSRFSRAGYFVLYDQEKGAWESLPSAQNWETARTAGIEAAQSLLKTGAGVLITGYVSRKAFKVLESGRVAMYSFGEMGEMDGTVESAVALFQAGGLSAIAVPNAIEIKKSAKPPKQQVPPYWGARLNTRRNKGDGM